ncbi:hypothetical protein SFV1gp31 [Sulfolobus filamentous virus 1]|uniref:Uncharacterized protein n=2 Tax=Alphalipothrixvirus beppuense TaxID=2734584 RepID=A0A346LU70_SUFV1|nr:hypothetical protein HOT91_gp31 [Sulfolobus filamentous virus 1]AXQ00113.1 hypothetical protein SFV1gp31 [Sulfolobus filamentous virus 1]AZI75733.1 hypothetical protein SBFV1_gp32 [Sulfolobales Beppu filamentous phage 1]
MYFNGDIVEGILRVGTATRVNGELLTRPLLLFGKFVLYGSFITREVERETLEGKTTTVNEIIPINGIIFSKFIQYIFVLSYITDPDTGLTYAYMVLLTQRTLNKLINYYKFWDIVIPNIDQELYEYTIEIGELR